MYSNLSMKGTLIIFDKFNVGHIICSNCRILKYTKDTYVHIKCDYALFAIGVINYLILFVQDDGSINELTYLKTYQLKLSFHTLPIPPPDINKTLIFLLT